MWQQQEMLLHRARANDPSLTELCLVYDQLIDCHIEKLAAALENNRHVKIVTLRGRMMRAVIHYFNEASYHLLADLDIDTLIIGCHHIGDDGARILSASPYIRKMDFYKCDISLDGAKYFLENKTLQEFTIEFNIWNIDENRVRLFNEKMRRVCDNNKRFQEQRAHEQLTAKRAYRNKVELIFKSMDEDDAGSLSALILTLKEGVNANISGKLLIQHCIDKNALNCVRFFLKSGLILEQSALGDTFLFNAALQGKLDVFRLFLPYSTDINGKFYAHSKKRMGNIAAKLLSMLFNFFDGNKARKDRLDKGCHRMLESFLSNWRDKILPYNKNGFLSEDILGVLVRRSDDFLYKFSMQSQAIIDQFKADTDAEKSVLAEMLTYSSIYKLLRKKRSINDNKHPFDWPEYYQKLGCGIQHHHIEFPVLTEIVDPITVEECELCVETLNSDFTHLQPNLLIAKFCTTQYSATTHTVDQIADDLHSCHLNRLIQDPTRNLFTSSPWDALQHGYALANYNHQGQPESQYLGKIYISLASAQQTVPQLFYEGVLELPSFDKILTEDVETFYQQRFNIDAVNYAAFRRLLLASRTRTNAIRDIIQHIVDHTASILFDIVLKECNRRGGYLIFHDQNTYSLQPPAHFPIEPNWQTQYSRPLKQAKSEDFTDGSPELIDGLFENISPSL